MADMQQEMKQATVAMAVMRQATANLQASKHAMDAEGAEAEDAEALAEALQGSGSTVRCPSAETGCICAAIACPQRFSCGRGRPAEQTKRKGKKAVTSEEILERLPPAKTPRASDGSGQPNCVVCLCEVDVDQDSITTQCGHVFHKECVLQWWTHKPRRSIRCPTCRTKQKIRNRQRDGDSTSRTQVTPATEESSDGDVGEGAGEAPEQQARRANSWLPELPDLEAGEGRPMQLPAVFAPSPYSAAPTDFTHMSVADEATPASQVSSLPVPGAQATRDTDDVESV